jgi:hypothetical protein
MRQIMAENEYRVRAVTRYVVTHFTSDGVRNAGSEQFGEFPNKREAETVGRALCAADPGSTFQTIMDAPEPCGIFYATTSEQAHALMAFIHSDAFPKTPDAADGGPAPETAPPV